MCAHTECLKERNIGMSWFKAQQMTQLVEVTACQTCRVWGNAKQIYKPLAPCLCWRDISRDMTGHDWCFLLSFTLMQDFFFFSQQNVWEASTTITHPRKECSNGGRMHSRKKTFEVLCSCYIIHCSQAADRPMMSVESLKEQCVHTASRLYTMLRSPCYIYSSAGYPT